MVAGRPSGEPLDLGTPGPVAQELVEVDPRGRVLLLPRIMAEIDWLDKPVKGEAQALAILDHPMIVRLVSFDDYGGAVLARRRELISAIDSDPDALETLMLLEDRYHRVKIPNDCRITLSNLLVAHLEIQLGKATLYVERLRNELRLLSPHARSQRLLSAAEQLKGLP
jgi:hypothetical protein